MADVNAHAWDGADPIGCATIRQVEGLRFRAFLDSVGRWTIGFGNTCHLDGTPVKEGDTLPDLAAAEALMLHALGLIKPKLQRLVHAPIVACQGGAMLSFAYNVGTGAFGSSTLLRKVNAGDHVAAADQFMEWDKGTVDGHKVTINGLENRRKIERAVYLGLAHLVTPAPVPAAVTTIFAAAAPAVSPPAAAHAVAAHPVAGPSAEDLNSLELARLQQPAREA